MSKKVEDPVAKQDRIIKSATRIVEGAGFVVKRRGLSVRVYDGEIARTRWLDAFGLRWFSRGYDDNRSMAAAFAKARG